MCVFNGRNQKFDMQFSQYVDSEYRELPELMRNFLLAVWEDVQREVEKRYGFPNIMVYTPSYTHKPENWETLATVLRRSPDDIFLLKKDLEEEAFRRRHRIVVGSPFKDKAGEVVYELDVIDVQWGKLVMHFDEKGGSWYMLDQDQLRYGPTAARSGYRVGRIDDALAGNSYFRSF